MDQPPKNNTLVAFLAAKGDFEIKGDRVDFKSNQIADRSVSKSADYIKRLLTLFVAIHFANKFAIKQHSWGRKFGSETKVYFEYYLVGEGVLDEHVRTVKNVYCYILKNTYVEDDLFSKEIKEADVTGFDLEEIDQKIKEYLSISPGSLEFPVSVGIDHSEDNLTVVKNYVPYLKNEEFNSVNRSFHGKLCAINFDKLEVSFKVSLNKKMTSEVVTCIADGHGVMERIFNAIYPYKPSNKTVFYCSSETRINKVNKNKDKIEIYITDIQIMDEEDYKLI